MRVTSVSFVGSFAVFTRITSADRYASNQNPIVLDSPVVAANFPDLTNLTLLSPAFINPQSVPATFTNGTSGPTPQRTLETFLKGIANKHSWITYHSNLVSEENRPIPYLTLSNNLTSRPKLRVWIQGGQHGDEPAGDQGVLALLAKLSNDPTWATSVLSKLDILLLPRYNADGVEYFQRALASNFDPNRDHTSLLRQQTRDVRRVQSAFDPHIFVDAHEYTGVGALAGQYVRAQDLLVSANKNPNVDASIRALNEAFVTSVFAAANARGLRTAPYFTAAVNGSSITVTEPDWHAQANHKGAGNYQALTFLVETRGIRLGAQHFQRRVGTQLLALETIVNKAAREFDAVYAAIDSGRKAFIASSRDIVVSDEYRVEDKAVEFVDAQSGRVVNVTVASKNSDPSVVTLTRRRPEAYVFSRAWAGVAERLRVLGVRVDELEDDFRGSVEALVVTEAGLEGSKFEGIAGTRVATKATRRTVVIPKGGFRVSTRQKNAGYAFVVLEPEGVASAAWYNLIPVEKGDEYPVFRLLQ